MTDTAIRELNQRGYCVLRAHLRRSLVTDCRNAFWPVLLKYLEDHADQANRGLRRHFLPMPFEPRCFEPDVFFDSHVLNVVRGVMGDRVVADQWGCDVPVQGSDYQDVHVDFRRPLFEEVPDLQLPPYMLIVSFGLVRIIAANGPLEIAPGTHLMRREEALEAVHSGEIRLHQVPLEIGDVLIRHPWALHRGTPNTTGTPRALASIRYVRRWYSDESREVNSISRTIWEALTPAQRDLLRFPVA